MLLGSMLCWNRRHRQRPILEPSGKGLVHRLPSAIVVGNGEDNGRAVVRLPVACRSQLGVFIADAVAIEATPGVDPGMVLFGIVDRIPGILGLRFGTQRQQRSAVVDQSVEVLHAHIGVADTQTIDEITVADIAVRARHRDIQRAIAVAQAMRQMRRADELIAGFIARGDLHGRDHRWRETAVVIARVAGGHRIVQQGRLCDPPRRDQRRPRIFHAGHQAIAVGAVARAGRVLDAALIHQAGEIGGLFGAAAETDRGHPDVGIWIVRQPARRLFDELAVHGLAAFFEGMALHPIEPVRAGTRAGEITRGDIGQLTAVLLIADLLEHP